MAPARQNRRAGLACTPSFRARPAPRPSVAAASAPPPVHAPETLTPRRWLLAVITLSDQLPASPARCTRAAERLRNLARGPRPSERRLLPASGSVIPETPAPDWRPRAPKKETLAR